MNSDNWFRIGMGLFIAALTIIFYHLVQNIFQIMSPKVMWNLIPLWVKVVCIIIGTGILCIFYARKKSFDEE